MDFGADSQHQVMGYDRAAQTFSPNGHILQVEYAGKAAKLGSSSIGIVCKDGVLIASDRKISDKLMKPESATKIHEVDSHIFAASSGIISDAKVLIEKAQVLAQRHMVSYDSPIDTESVMREIASAQQQFTQYGGARPFGVAILIAGVNDDKPQLFTSDVTGNYFAYSAVAIGEHCHKIKDELEKEYSEKLDIDKGIKLSLKILKKVLGKEFSLEKIDVGFVKIGEKLKKLNGDDLKDFD